MSAHDKPQERIKSQIFDETILTILECLVLAKIIIEELFRFKEPITTPTANILYCQSVKRYMYMPEIREEQFPCSIHEVIPK